MRTSPIFFYRSRGPTSSRRWGPPPAFGAQGCRSLGSRACERITLNAKIAKRAKHLFERFFLCGLRGLCVDVISSYPLLAERRTRFSEQRLRPHRAPSAAPALGCRGAPPPVQKKLYDQFFEDRFVCRP